MPSKHYIVMKHLKLFTWMLALLLLAGYEAQAQERIEGTVRNAKGEALEFVNVVVKRLPDSTFVTGTTTNAEGAFVLPSIPTKSLIIFSLVGYRVQCLAAQPKMQVTLAEESSELSTLVVQGRRPQIKLREGMLEMPVQGTSLVKRSDIFEVLGQMPGLHHTPGGGVSLITGGTLAIYLNGREVVQLDELRALDIRQIKSLRLDTAPGVRYRRGIKAVLHIRTTRDLSALSVRAKSWARIGQHLSHSQEANLSYNQGKASYYLFGSYSQFKSHSFQDLNTIITETKGTTVEEQLHTTLSKDPDARSLQVMTGMNLQPSERLQFGLKYNLDRSSHYDFLSDQSRSTRGKQINDEIKATTDVSQGSTAHHVNAFGSYSLSPKLDLTLTADYYGKHSIRDQSTMEESLTHQTKAPFVIHTQADRHLVQGNTFLTYKPRSGQALELGAEVSHIGGDSHQFYNAISKTSNFSNSESLLAGFASYSFGIGTWRTQLGLRYEQAKSELRDRLHSGKDIERTWGDLFYNLNVSGNIGKTMHSLSLNSSIQRPSMEQLSLSSYRSNPYLIQEGNPKLTPEHQYRFNYNLVFSKYYFAVNYTHYRDLISPYLYANRALTSGYILGITNFRSGNELQLVGNVRQQWGWYTLELTGVFKYSQVDGKREGLTLPVLPLYYVRWDNSFDLPRGYHLDIQYSYQSQTTQQVFKVSEQHQLNIYANKNFFGGKLQVSLGLYDVLKTSNQGAYTEIGGIILNQREELDSRRVALSLTYRFNKERKWQGRESARQAIGRM